MVVENFFLTSNWEPILYFNNECENKSLFSFRTFLLKVSNSYGSVSHKVSEEDSFSPVVYG